MTTEQTTILDGIGEHITLIRLHISDLRASVDALANSVAVSTLPARTPADWIIDVVSAESGVSREAILGSMKTLGVVTARHFAVKKVLDVTKLSTREIASVFGMKSHASVTHAATNACEIVRHDPRARDLMRRIETQLKKGQP